MKKISLLTLLFVIPLSVQLAAQETPTREPPVRDQQQPTTTAKQFDRPLVEFFAAKLVLCNKAQIQAANMAKEKATNAEVKQFAEMLLKDHTQANEKLRSFVASYAAAHSGGAEPRVAEAARQTDPANPPKQDLAKGDKPADPKAKPVDPQAKPADRAVTETSLRTGDSATLQRVFEFYVDAHEAHMAKCKEMMSKLSGADFDKAWMAAQIGAHVAFLAELTALESRSTDQFQTAIRDIRTTVESHLQKAEAICKQLDSTKPTSIEGKTEKPADIKR